MGVTLFFNGLLVGIFASVPVGAVAILSVQKTLNTGLIAGFVLGLGAAVADLIFASIAAFGVTIISDFLFTHRVLLGVIGSIFLLIIGYNIFFTDTVKEFRSKKNFSKKTLANDFFSSMLIALSNPITILGFGGVFASFGVIHEAHTKAHLITLLAGVFSGAITWWFTLSSIIDIFRRKINLRKIVMINRITGFFIFCFGIILIITIIFSTKFMFYHAPDFLY